MKIAGAEVRTAPPTTTWQPCARPRQPALMSAPTSDIAVNASRQPMPVKRFDRSCAPVCPDSTARTQKQSFRLNALRPGAAGSGKAVRLDRTDVIKQLTVPAAATLSTRPGAAGCPFANSANIPDAGIDSCSASQFRGRFLHTATTVHA